MAAWRYKISLLVFKNKRNFVSPRGHVISSTSHKFLYLQQNKWHFLNFRPFFVKDAKSHRNRFLHSSRKTRFKNITTRIWGGNQSGGLSWACCFPRVRLKKLTVFGGFHDLIALKSVKKLSESFNRFKRKLSEDLKHCHTPAD